MKVATDIGGTFTDLVAIDEFGSLILEKAHTTPPNFDQGVMDVLEKSGLEPRSIDAFFHGTTTIINALTERKGAKTALITTKGFRDILELARGNRPDLFNLVFEKPAPFVPRYLRREVTERISYKGEVITPLCEEDIAKAVDYMSDLMRIPAVIRNGRAPESISLSFPISSSTAKNRILCGIRSSS